MAKLDDSSPESDKFVPHPPLRFTLYNQEDGTEFNGGTPNLYLDENFIITLQSDQPLGKIWMIIINDDNPGSPFWEPFLGTPPIRCVNKPESVGRIYHNEACHKGLMFEATAHTSYKYEMIAPIYEESGMTQKFFLPRSVPLNFFANWQLVVIQPDYPNSKPLTIPLMVQMRQKQKLTQMKDLIEASFPREDFARNRLVNQMERLENEINDVYQRISKLNLFKKIFIKKKKNYMYHIIF